MRPYGQIIGVAGSDPKAGSSMIAKSLAQGLAKQTGEAILYLTEGDGSRVVAPWNDAEIGLAESGLSHLETVRWKDIPGELRGRFAFAVLDGGTVAAEYADRVILVVNQLASSIRAAERVAPLLAEKGTGDGTAKAEPGSGERERSLLCLNRYLAGDPYDTAYLKQLFPEWDVLPVPESPRGREADWEGVTIAELGDRPFRRAVREGVKWILRN